MDCAVRVGRLSPLASLAPLACVAGIAVLLSCLVGRASAQTGDSGTVVRGMFGPRVIGEPLRPRPSQSSSGIIRGPSGEFYGIGRPEGSLFRGNRLPTSDRLNQTVPVPPAWLRDSAVPAGVADAYRRPPDPIPVQDITAGPSGLPAFGGDLPLRNRSRNSKCSANRLAPRAGRTAAGAEARNAKTRAAQSEPAGSNTTSHEASDRAIATGAATAARARGSTERRMVAQSVYDGRAASAARAVGGQRGQAAPRPIPAPANRGVIITSRSMSRSARVVSSRGAAADPAGAAVESTLRNVRPARPNMIRATVEGGTMVLRGRVASEHDRAVAEAAARMEPGVESVRNELRIETPAAAK